MKTPKLRIGICRIMQESNSFLLDEDGLTHFEQSEAILLGDQLITELDRRDDEIKGFVNALHTSSAKVEILPVLSASGFAGGLIATEAVEYFADAILPQVKEIVRRGLIWAAR